MMLYWLELERPLEGSKRNCQIYAGYAKDERTYARRMKDHVKGRGAAFTREAVRQGIKFKTVCIMPEGTREDERRFKKWKKSRQVVEMLKKKGYGPWL